MNSSKEHSCPKCGQALSPSAAEGLCARCLFSQLEQDDGAELPMAAEEPEGDFGDYELFEEIGEGGMGIVYRARQVSLDRPVAIKVIKLGMDTRSTIARFETERQALALMDHPNIARVIDAGASRAGRPYFVMELVNGIKITDYCDQQHYSVDQRLKLFLDVCAAVQHAHQKGIIHRDLKPSNILVAELDGQPLPKVIDFGIAKAIESEESGQTLLTALGQFVGTPAYLSPEQAALGSADIDTRSDIYSLGVVLYELLTGNLPFEPSEFATASLEEVRNAIRERRPPRPSTRITKRTQNGKVSGDIQHLAGQVRGDLDWIVMRCLEKARERRYETANGIAADIVRHLNNEPIVARPPSFLYLLQKSIQRNWLAYAAVAGIAAALLIGLTIALWQFVEKSHAEAEQRLLRSEAEANAYASDMNVAKAALDKGNLGRVRELLDRHRPKKPDDTDLRGWEWRWLWDQSRSDATLELCRMSSEISALTASHDGRWLAVAEAEGGGLEIWDLEDRPRPKVTSRLSESGERIRAEFSPVGPLLAYSSSRSAELSTQKSATLHLWNSDTGQELSRIGLGNECVGIAFSNDGERLLISTSEGGSGEIILYQIDEEGTLEEKAKHASKQYGEDIEATGFAANSELSVAAYGEALARLHVIDLSTGRERRFYASSTEGYVSAIAFSPDGRTLAGAFGPTEMLIRLWDVESQAEVGRLTGHPGSVTALEFTPDGKKLISSGTDKSIRLWDIESETEIDVLRGHGAGAGRLECMPDGVTLYSSSKDGTVSRWDMSMEHARRKPIVIDRIERWRFTEDPQSIFVVERNGRVSRRYGHHFEQSETLLDPDPPSPTDYYPRNYLISANAEYAARATPDGQVNVWNRKTGIWEHQLKAPNGDPVLPYEFIDDLPQLSTLSKSREQYQIWDVRTGELLIQLPPLYPSAGRVAGSPEGLTVEFGFDRDVRILQMSDQRTTMERLDYLRGKQGTFSPDGELMAITSGLGYARVWDTRNWQLVHTLGGIGSGAEGVCFSPDGRRLAVSDDGGNSSEALRLWDSESGLDVLTLESEFGNFINVKFSPDGNTISLRGGRKDLILLQAPSWEAIEAEEKRSESIAAGLRGN